MDPYSATWVSSSRITDFSKCSRAFYLKYIYRDPITGNKISLVNQSLVLGQAVHDTLEPLARIPAAKRLSMPLQELFEKNWETYKGYIGLFSNFNEEETVKSKGLEMIKRIQDNPGPIARPALRLSGSDPKFPIPHFFISEKENIILSGKIDWLEYIPETDGIRIIDFKTGKREESAESLQLPIYVMLTQACQRRIIEKVAYWYLDSKSEPTEVEMQDIEDARKYLIELGIGIRETVRMRRFSCVNGGCFACNDMEEILRGNARLVDSRNRQDIYVLKTNQ